MKEFWHRYAFEIVAVAVIIAIVFANASLYGRTL